MDKIILVIYVPVGRLRPEEIGELMTKMGRSLEPRETDGIIHYLIPTKDENGRIECLNPKLMSEAEFITAERVLEDTKVRFERFLESWVRNQE